MSFSNKLPSFPRSAWKRRAGRSASCLALLAVCAVAPVAAVAQQRPEVGYVFPPGGRAGSTVDVRLGGYDFTPDTQFFVLDERVQLEVLGPPGEMLFLPPPHWFGPKAGNKAFPVPREVPARLVIPPDVPPGVIHWQAANANGATLRGSFVVERGTNEVLEDAEADVHELPSLPVTVSGQLQRKEEVDAYRFQTERDGPVTVRLPALGVGYPVHGVVEVTDSSGNRVAEAADTAGNGLVLTFAATAGESYTLVLHDVDFRGDRSMVYRLAIEAAPGIVTAIPAAGPRGTEQAVAFIGYGLATGKPQWESITREVAFPADADRDSFVQDVETPFGTATCELGLSDLVERVEPESADDASRRIEPGTAVTGQLETNRGNAFLLTAVKGETYDLAVDAKRIGSPLDVSLAVVDADGKTVAENDDRPDTTDAGLQFTAKADGDYRLVVRDVGGRAGEPTSVYRLKVTQPTPGFTLSVPERAETIVGAEPIDVTDEKRRRRGDDPGVLTIKVDRTAGFDGPIAIELDGLPPGITLAETIEIPEKAKQVDVAIPCAADASSLASLVTVRATAALDDGTRLADEARVIVAPMLKPRAVVRPLYPDAGRTVHRGATYMAPVVLERLEDYEGEVELQMAAHPDRVRQGISGQDVSVPAGVDQVEYPLFLPEWVQTDRTSRIVLNTVVRIPDGAGRVRHLVNRMDRRITMNVEGALLKLSASRTEFAAKPGETIAVPLAILRSGKFAGPVEIRLDRVDGRPTFEAEPVTVPADESEAVFPVAVPEDAFASGEHELTLRATGSLGESRGRLESMTRVFVLPDRR